MVKSNGIIIAPIESSKKVEDEWVWIEGYKGTDKNMRCLGYQYEMNTEHKMPDNQNVELCTSGFHLCTNLKDVFNYYNVGDGNRFFKVKALVPKMDNTRRGMFFMIDSKQTSKSIIFTEELTPDEVLRCLDIDISDWTNEEKRRALETCVKYVVEVVNARVNAENIIKLTKLGYSETFAAYVVERDKYDIAYTVGTQEGLSMDMKVFAILK